jgi:hypothetical protein
MQWLCRDRSGVADRKSFDAKSAKGAKERHV